MKTLHGFSALMIRPSTMANQPSMGDSYHVSLIKPVLSAERRKVRDRADDTPLRVNEPVISFGVWALANTVSMCPPLVRLQLTVSLSQSDHRRVIKVMESTELTEIRNRHFVARWVNKSMPRLSELVAWRACDWINVKSDGTVGAVSADQPQLLRSQ